MKVRITKTPRKAKNGASISPLSGDMSLFNGPSHENGGIPYKGIEVEGGEPLYQNMDGSETVFGNMFVPGTGQKFKQVAKVLAKKDQKVDKLVEKAATLVNNHDWTDKWDELKYNSGKAMLEGGMMKKKELKQNKEHLANIQQAMLETADEMGVDPFELSKGKMVKAKNGYKLKAANGINTGDDDPKKESMAKRMNNPGNIKFGAFAKKFGAVKGDPATDGGYFAKFPDTNTGLTALKGLLKTDGYKNLSVDAAIKRWTNGSGYKVDYKDIKDKTVNSLNDDEFTKLINTITSGEDGKYYTQPTTKTNTPTGTTEDYPTPTLKTFTPTGKKTGTYNPRTVGKGNYDLNVTPIDNKSIPTNAKPMEWWQVAPELTAFAQNKVEPVWMQQYNPQLYQKTSVSFQDRLNQNQASFNSLKRIMGDDPAALSELAANKYTADNNVQGEEFRTNQQIEQDIVNKNISLLNDAQLRNLQLADQQYTRQTQARANTKALNNTILNSITGKLAQNESRNQALQYYESLSDYRYNPQSGKVEYMGPNLANYLSSDGTGNQGQDMNTSVTKNYNKDGQVTSTQYKTPGWLDQAIKVQQYEQGNYKQRNQILGDNSFNATKFFNSSKKGR